MFKVNNKKCIRNIATKSFLSNKTRNMIAVTAIALTTLLFTAVFTIGSVFIHSFEQSNFRQTGTYAHGTVKEVSYDDVAILKEHQLIKEYAISRMLGTISEGAFAKIPVEVKYVSENDAKFAFIDFIEGRMPKENTNEMVCDTKVLKALGIEPIIGSEITFTYEMHDGIKITDTFTLSGYWQQNELLGISFIYLPQSYVDSVIAKNPMTNGVTNSEIGRIDMDILLHSSNNIENDIITIIEESGFEVNDINSDNYRRYGINWGYTATNTRENFDTGTSLFALVLLILFILSGYLIIFNIFKISVSNDIKFFGLLKTIGTTKKQIRKIVYRQAFILSAIGIPIGLICGFVVGSIIAPTVVSNFNVSIIKLTINPYIFIGGALFSLVTVVVSCRRPSVIAAKVSPVEAVKYTEVKMSKKSKRKNRKITPFNMAMANMKRSMGKTTIVVISLSLAIFILQIAVLFTNGFDMKKYLKNTSVADFLIGNVNYLNANSDFNEDIALSDEEISMFKALNGVKSSGVVYGKTFDTYALNEQSAYEDQRDFTYISIYGMDSLALEKINVFKGSLENLKDNEIIAVYQSDDFGKPIMDSNSKKIGDTITIRYVSEMGYYNLKTDELIENIDNYTDEYYVKPLEYKDVDYKVIALATVPYKLGYRMYIEGCDIFALSSEQLLNTTTGFEPMNLLLDVEQDKIESITDFLENYTNSADSMLNFESREKSATEFHSFKNMFMLIGTLLSMVVGFIGILNFFNVILTSINMRKREFAMLQSIGMTGKQLKQTLVFESISYIVVTAILVSVTTFITMPMLTQVMSGMFWFYSSKFTISPILIILPILLLVGVYTPLLIYKITNKHSIIERLRETE